MPRIDRESGVDVLVDENVVKERHLRSRAIPSAIPEHRIRRPTFAFENDVRRVLGRKSAPFDYGERVVRR